MRLIKLIVEWSEMIPGDLVIMACDGLLCKRLGLSD